MVILGFFLKFMPLEYVLQFGNVLTFKKFNFNNRQVVFRIPLSSKTLFFSALYEGHLESKERFAIKKYLLIIGKKKNMQVLSHTFTYFST